MPTFRSSSVRRDTAGSDVPGDLPAGVQPGDLLLAFLTFNAAGITFTQVPAGWAHVGTDTFGNVTSGVFWKIAGAGEPSSYEWRGSSTSDDKLCTIAAYYGDVDTGSPVHAYGSAGSTSSTPAAPSVTTGEDGLTVLVNASIYHTGTKTSVLPPAGTTTRSEFVSSYRSMEELADFVQTTAGATGSKSFDIYAKTGTIYTVAFTVALNPSPNTPPSAPVLTVPADGAGVDRNSTQRFDWDFSDPDAGDSQSKFDLRYRAVGAGSWTDVSGTTPNTYWDAPAGTFAAGDYEWQVRTYDAQGVVGPYSSSSFFTAGDAPAMPTITAPVNGGTFLQTETVEWSTPGQDSYQIQVRDTGDVVVYDSGEVTSQTARSAQVPFPDNGTTRKLRVRVKDGGLWSPWYEITGTVSWLAPPTPSFTLLADDANGALGVSIINPAPTGEEPAAVYNDVYVDDGDGFETKYGSRQIAPNGTWTYWQPVGGRDYSGSIRVTAVADNGVTSSS